jgi:hypothetical protein
MRFYIKEERFEDFKANYEKYGFKIDHHGDYYKYVGNRRVVWVYKWNRSVTDLKIDHTTYDGYMYEGEYRHRTKTYIYDLIVDGYIEAKKE